MEGGGGVVRDELEREQIFTRNIFQKFETLQFETGFITWKERRSASDLLETLIQTELGVCGMKGPDRKEGPK